MLGQFVGSIREVEVLRGIQELHDAPCCNSVPSSWCGARWRWRCKCPSAFSEKITQFSADSGTQQPSYHYLFYTFCLVESQHLLLILRFYHINPHTITSRSKCQMEVTVVSPFLCLFQDCTSELKACIMNPNTTMVQCMTDFTNCLQIVLPTLPPFPPHAVSSQIV